jgi:hypothetical protein
MKGVIIGLIICILFLTGILSFFLLYDIIPKIFYYDINYYITEFLKNI